MKSLYAIAMLLCTTLIVSPLMSNEGAKQKQLTAGTAKVCINPEKFPVLVNGGFTTQEASSITEPVYVRAFALDNGHSKIVLATIDVCILDTGLTNSIRQAASEKTGIPVSNIGVMATHTHSSGSFCAVLGCPIDEEYSTLVKDRAVDAIVRASRGTVPVQVAWGKTSWPEGTHCRVWITRPDTMLTDPFGEQTVRAMMHPGYQNPNFIGPCGPVNSQMALLSFQTLDGKPFAVLGNYAMHYFGSTPVSPDYTGRFCQLMEEAFKIDSSRDSGGIVIQFQGTSGDQHWMNYALPPKNDINLDKYSREMVQKAQNVLKDMKRYETWVPVETRYVVRPFQRRQPNESRYVWARETVGQLDHAIPHDHKEVYAFETLYTHDEPVRNIPLVGMRIGDVGLCLIPCEIYGITGIKLNRQSPFPVQMTLELANGGEGYIPPPEIHPFGGYNTWTARSAGLVPSAETEIVEQSLQFLEDLSGQKRKTLASDETIYSQRVLSDKPIAFWRLNLIEGTTCPDSVGSATGTFKPCTAYFLEGPEFVSPSNERVTVPAVHFAGGKLVARVKELPNDYTFETWIWNGLPADNRVVTGYLFSRGTWNIKDAPGDHFGISGTAPAAKNHLFLFNGNDENLLSGKAELPWKTWVHVALVRQGDSVSLYLNGQLDAKGTVPRTFNQNEEQITLANRCDNFCGLEGKMAEAALYARALTPGEIETHWKNARNDKDKSQ